MLSLIIASDWPCAFNAEMAEDSAPERLISWLQTASGCDADDARGRDGGFADHEHRGAARTIDRGHGAGDGGVAGDRGSAGIGGGYGQRILPAVRKLRSIGGLAVPGEAVAARG